MSVDKKKVQDYGEVFTPLNIVLDMLSMLPNISTEVILEPSCGHGIFLIEILKQKLKNNISILDAINSLYGIDIQEENVIVTRNNILTYLENNYSIEHIHTQIVNILNKNIKQADFLVCPLEENKYDIIIGNPPYQDSTNRNGAGGGKSLYHLFIDKSIKYSKRYVSFIIPSSWMLGYPKGIKKEWVNNFRGNYNIKEIHDFKDAHWVFPDVTINSGVDYFLLDKEKQTNNIDLYIHNNNSNEKITINIKKGKEILRDIYGNIVYNHIEKDLEYTFDKLVGGKEYFTIPAKNMHTSWKEYVLIKETDDMLEYLANFSRHKVNCKIAYVKPSQVKKNLKDAYRPKLYESSAVFYTQKRIIDKPILSTNPSVCSESYIPIFSPNDDIVELENIAKYMQTKFFRYLVSLMKKDQSLPSTVYKLVPILNNSQIDWNNTIFEINQQLYQYYNIPKNICDYIDTTIEDLL